VVEVDGQTVMDTPHGSLAVWQIVPGEGDCVGNWRMEGEVPWMSNFGAAMAEVAEGEVAWRHTSAWFEEEVYHHVSDGELRIEEWSNDRFRYRVLQGHVCSDAGLAEDECGNRPVDVVGVLERASLVDLGCVYATAVGEDGLCVAGPEAETCDATMDTDATD